MACVCVKLKCSLKTGIKIELLAATNPQKIKYRNKYQK